MRFNLRFESCDTMYEIKNVDPNEYNYIVFTKEMKKCIAYKNEKAFLYLGEQIMVKAKMFNKVGRYVTDSDEGMSNMFKQYSKVGVKNIECLLNLFQQTQ